MKSRIKELLNSEESILVFDVDGVLARMEFGIYTHYDVDDLEFAKLLYEKDLYEDIKPFKVMQEFLKDKNMKNVYVITRVMNDIELIYKKRYLKRNYNIIGDNVFLVMKDTEKKEILKNIHSIHLEKEEKDIVMIDDNINVLNDIMENTKFSTVHISSFLN